MSGRKIASVRTAYLTISRRSPGSWRANQFVALEIINDSLHAEGGFVRRNFVSRCDIVDDLAHCFAFFEAFPHDHRRFVQLKVFLGIEIDEYSFTAVKIRNHYVFAWC